MTASNTVPELPTGVYWRVDDLPGGAKLLRPVHEATGLELTGNSIVLVGPDGEVIPVHSVLAGKSAALAAFCKERYEDGVRCEPSSVHERLRELAGFNGRQRMPA